MCIEFNMVIVGSSNWIYMGISLRSGHIQNWSLNQKYIGFFFTKNVEDISMFHRQPRLISTIHHVGLCFTCFRIGAEITEQFFLITEQ